LAGSVPHPYRISPRAVKKFRLYQKRLGNPTRGHRLRIRCLFIRTYALLDAVLDTGTVVVVVVVVVIVSLQPTTVIFYFSHLARFTHARRASFHSRGFIRVLSRLPRSVIIIRPSVDLA